VLVLALRCFELEWKERTVSEMKERSEKRREKKAEGGRKRERNEWSQQA
jgi:hypothetical protein